MLSIFINCGLTTYKQKTFRQIQTSYQQKRSRNKILTVKAQTIKKESSDVLIIGAGVAGLACAGKLIDSGLNPILLEASDDVGGRVRTDEVDGFLLDRGFQIFLSSYPNANRLLDYEKLDLRPFYAGALVYYNGSFHRVADPFRHLSDAIGTLFNPIGSVFDKISIGRIRLQSLTWDLNQIYSKQETTIAQRLQEEGFSSAIVDRFFRPFLGGIFFNRQLTTTSRMFEFVMKMLATGQNCFPADGIGQVAHQLAEKIPKQNIRLGHKVISINRSNDSQSIHCLVKSTSGEESTFEVSRCVVVATQGDIAQSLLSNYGVDKSASHLSHAGKPVGTCCLYFTADAPPSTEPILFLNGEDNGIINNCCIPTNVANTYSKDSSRTLISASTVGIHEDLTDEELERQTREQLREWFGKEQVAKWQHLKTYRIPYAQPCQEPPTNLERAVEVEKWLYVCGDHRQSATLDGVIVSGIRAAEAVLKSA